MRARAPLSSTTTESAWFVNRFRGRDLRMEYAEDATTRYNKRFGKKEDATTSTPVASADRRQSTDKPALTRDRQDSGAARKPKSKSEGQPDEERAPAPRPRVPQLEASKDKAYLTGAVMEGKGKKIVASRDNGPGMWIEEVGAFFPPFLSLSLLFPVVLTPVL